MVIVVEIEDRSCKKPFLGGWRNVVTKVEYHNACTQTRPRDSKIPHDLLNTRDTQTAILVDKNTNMPCDKSTQMSSNRIYVPNVRDKFLTPGKFVPREDENSLNPEPRAMEVNVVKIQKFYRAYRTRIMVKRFATISRAMVKDSIPDFHGARGMRHENRRQLEIIRPTPPKSRADFEMLYNIVDRWRVAEIERANRTFFRSSELAAHSLILQKEIELLRAIDAIKTEVRKLETDRKNSEFLHQQSKPISWTGYKGITVSMETLRVQRAKEYKKLYNSLSNNNVTVNERVDLLVIFKQSLRRHNCGPVREVAYLIDQELDLLAHNIGATMLYHLRNRLRYAFLLLVRNSRFCSGVCGVDEFAEHEGVARHLEGSTKSCRRCGKLLPLDGFAVDKYQRISSVCNDCECLAKGTTPRIVYQPYEHMLNDIRRSERRKKCYTSVAFVLGPKAIHHLVNNVWHGKSGISECNDINRLSLVRFRPDVEWSPWNSIVLTRDEAAMHVNIKNVAEVYSKELIKKFRRTNLQAKLNFLSSGNFQERHLESTDSDAVQNPKKDYAEYYMD